MVTGTAPRPGSGPGVTADSHRLNFMLTRHKCGLVVVSNINVVAKETKKTVQTETVTGKMGYVNINALKEVYGTFTATGRVIGLNK